MTINRRSFLKASALTVAGTMITPEVINGQSRSAANGQRVFKAQDPKVRELLARMTLEEKIGQMIQTERGALKDISDVENYFIGSFLSGGTSDLDWQRWMQQNKAVVPP